MAEPIPREQRRSERVWYWEEANPKTRTIIGALEAAEIPYKPSLLKVTASAAMEGFGVSLDYLNETYDRQIKELAEMKGIDHDTDAIPRAIVDGLRSWGPEEAGKALAELGRCASRRSWAAEIASRVTDQIFFDDDPYQAIPTLKALSTLAMYRLAVGVPDGEGRMLPFVTPPPPTPAPAA